MSNKTHSFLQLVWGFVKWILIGVLIGVLCGAVGTFFHYCIEFVTEFRLNHDWIILFLPIAGIVITLAYRFWGMDDDKGTNLVIESVRSGKRVSIKMMILIFFGTVATHMFGGSAGREGAALQIGGSLSAQIGRFLKLDKKDMSIMLLCGMSAGFSALFGTPFTAAIFAMEVVAVGIMQYSAMVPCIVASLTAAKISSCFGFAQVGYSVNNIPDMNIGITLKVIGLSICCALISILFCVTLHYFQKTFKKYFSNSFVRIVIGALAVVGLTYVMGNGDYNGAGSEIIALSFVQKIRPEVFILKILFTAVTLGAGFKGGEIVPSLFVGATFGNLMAQIFGIDPAFGAALGMVAVFCGVTNCPLASIFLSIELFGIGGLPFYGLAIAVSYMLSGYEGLYSGQKIFYSKLKPELIDKNTGHWSVYNDDNNI